MTALAWLLLRFGLVARLCPCLIPGRLPLVLLSSTTTTSSSIRLESECCLAYLHGRDRFVMECEECVLCLAGTPLHVLTSVMRPRLVYNAACFDLLFNNNCVRWTLSRGTSLVLTEAA